MARKDSFLRGRIRSFGYAFRGIWTVASSQINFRIQLAAGIIAVALGFRLEISLSEWMAIIIVCSLVLGAETLNTIIEILCDKIQPEYNSAIGSAKDMAAGAVLIFSTGALIIGGIIFVPKLLDVIFTR